MNLKPIKPKRVSDQVFEQIQTLIAKGDFKPGQQILPERELAATMHVSRTSVRNAINKLVTMGHLEHRQGQGTFVASPDNQRGNPLAAAMQAEEATLEDLLEVRLGLECNAATLAAARASEEDLQAISDTLDAMQQDFQTTDRIGSEADAAFHMAVVFATKNPVLIHLMRNFYDFLFIGIKKKLTHMYEDKEALQQVILQHQEVYTCIKERKPPEAGKAMQEHIRYIQHYFQSNQ